MIKKFIKSGIFLTLFILYRMVSPFMKWGELVVLMHHSVGPDDWQFTVKPEAFNWQIDNLRARGFAFISAEEFLSIIEGQKPMPRRAVLLTFDDGYRNIMDWALPVLKKFNIPSLLFIHADRSLANLNNALPLLSWQDIRDAIGQGVTIGSHSYSHPDMKTLSRTELEAEIKMAEEIFQKEISQKPWSFAFPGGRYNQSVVDGLRENGYEAAFTINPYLTSLNHDHLKLPRVGVVRNTGKIEFIARTTRANDWYQTIVGVLFGGKPKK